MKTASTPFLPVLATMSLFACIAPSARADRAENAFVKVRAVGADVTRVDGRNFSAQGDIEVEIEAQPGWTLLTPSRVRVTKGRSPHYQVRSSGGEQTGGGDIWRTVTERVRVHVQDPALTATLDAGGPYVYAAPSNGVWVAVSGSATGTPGLHVWEVRTTVYKNGEVVDTSAEIEPGDPFPLELDRWKWTWSPGAPGETNVQSFVSEPVLLPKGTYTASGTAEAWSSQCPDCHASKPASEPFVVSLLTISCNPWIGQDRTGDPSAPYTSPKVTATASLDPANPDVKKVTWGGVNKCEKRDPKDWSLTLWTEDRDLASDTYLGEKVSASVAGATATTNFTIVKVDVTVGGVQDEMQEINPGMIIPLNGTSPQISSGPVPVCVECLPTLPPSEYVVLVVAERNELCIGPEMSPAEAGYKADTIGTLPLYLVGNTIQPQERAKYFLAFHKSSSAEDRVNYDVCKLVYRTTIPSPVGNERNRTRIGVAEDIEFAIVPAKSVVWRAFGGGTIKKDDGFKVEYEAKHGAGEPIIVAKMSKYSNISLPLEVVQPTSIRVDQPSALEYPNGTAAVGLHFPYIWFDDGSVSFSKVVAQEVGLMSEDPTGYFLDVFRQNPDKLDHAKHGAEPDKWIPSHPILGRGNSRGNDTAFWIVGSDPKEWKPNSGFTWIIPARWKIRESADSTAIEHDWSDQRTDLRQDGTMTLAKFGYSATRDIHGNRSISNGQTGDK